MNRMKALWNDRKGAVIGLSVVLFLLLLRFALGLPCPIQHLAGISCLGCGMTRALWSLVTLDFAGAWHYHPAAFALLPAIVLWSVFRLKHMKKAASATLFGFISLMILVYLCRLFTGDGNVVSFAPQNGEIARLLTGILPR